MDVLIKNNSEGKLLAADFFQQAIIRIAISVLF
jgi:hypothetical protein